MRDLDRLLSPTTGHDLVTRAADAAGASDLEALARRGAHRRRRNVALATTGAAASVALVVGISATVLRPDADAGGPPTPSTQEPRTTAPEDLRDVRPRDLTPEQVPQVPGAVVEQAVLGADLDRRAVVWQARGRSVLARTTDGGDTWDYTGEPGQYFELAPLPGDAYWLAVNGPGPERAELLVGPDGEPTPIRTVDDLAAVADDEALVTLHPGVGAERQVAVDPDGSAHSWPGDPRLEEQRTGVVDAWAPAVRLPTGVIVQQVAGPQQTFGGVCCAARSVVRWSDDGGTTWETRDLDALGADPDAIYPFTVVVPSLDPAVVAVHESTEGGTPDARPLLGTQRFASDGSSADRFADQLTLPQPHVAWSVVLPDGELLVWAAPSTGSEGGGPWRSEGEDWHRMSEDPALLPPAGVDATGLALVDARLVDGEARVVAVADSGAMLVVEGDDVRWTSVQSEG